jgi:hypothetical protein
MGNYDQNLIMIDILTVRADPQTNIPTWPVVHQLLNSTPLLSSYRTERSAHFLPVVGCHL